MFKVKKFASRTDGRIEPFRIIGNLYFVGCWSASSHLIDTGDGLILIDTGYIKTFDLLCASIESLGFKLKDIKYIINSHWHYDHAEVTGLLAKISGAKTIIGCCDYKNAMRYFDADIRVKDGDILELGNTEIKFLETPGHTRGTISFFFKVESDGRTYRVGSFGGAGTNTLVPREYDFEGCREAYFKSIEKLRQEEVDVFIGNHVWNNNTEEHGIILRETGENRFINPSLWQEYLTFCENKLKRLIEKENNI